MKSRKVIIFYAVIILSVSMFTTCDMFTIQPRANKNDPNAVNAVSDDYPLVISSVISLGAGAHGALSTVSPSGQYVFIPTQDDAVKVIDTYSNSIVDTIVPGFDPIGVKISPDGLVGYITNTVNGYYATKFNAETFEIIGNVSTGTDSAGLAFSPDGTKVYMANNWSSYLNVISVASNTNTTTISGIDPGGSSVAITPDGSYVYVGGRTGNIFKVNTSTNTVESTIVYDFGGGSAQVITFNPAGDKLYAAGWESEAIHIFDASTDSELLNRNFNSRVGCVDVSKDGTLLAAVFQDDDQLRLLSAIDLSDIAILQISGAPSSVQFSPDDKHLYVSTHDSGELVTVEVNMPHTLSYQDDFSTDTGANYSSDYFVTQGSGIPQISTAVESGRLHITNYGNGAYNYSLIRRNESYTIPSGSDFDFSIDGYRTTSDSYRIGIGLWSDSNRTKFLEFRYDDYNNNLAIGTQDNLLYSASADPPDPFTLRVRRLNGVYTCWIDGTQVFNDTVPELDNINLNYGVLCSVTSGPTVTAHNYYDNWSFSE